MSNSSKDNSNPFTMTDVDLVRDFDGARTGVTVYDGDWTQVENLLCQGYEVEKVVTIL